MLLLFGSLFGVSPLYMLAFYIISIYKHCIKNGNQHEMETTTRTLAWEKNYSLARKRDIIESRARALCDHRCSSMKYYLCCAIIEWRNENVNNSNRIKAPFFRVSTVFAIGTECFRSYNQQQCIIAKMERSSLIGKCVEALLRRCLRLLKSRREGWNEARMSEWVRERFHSAIRSDLDVDCIIVEVVNEL